MKNTYSTNNVTLRVFLGSDPQVFKTKKDQESVRFTLTTHSSYFDTKPKAFKDRETVWHNNLTSFNPKVVELVKGLSKGSGLEVQGTLSYKTIDGADGNKYDVAFVQIVHTEIWINARELLSHILANCSETDAS